MRPHEDYTRILIIALVLAVGILIAFQIYLLREPGRIAGVLAADQQAQVARGEKIFADNCATCHGKQGEGDLGPALNSKKFLTSTDDGVIFSLVASGVPGTGMPSWSQAHGGPFTDEQIRDVVSYIRHWEPTAPDLSNVSPTPDIGQGKVIFDSTCYICHGVNGVGTDRAPALNSKELLSQFDDAWFRQTIAQGRPAKGMPTWGQVLSPAQINAVVAYIRSWQSTAPSTAATPTMIAMPTSNATPVAQATPAPTEAQVEMMVPSNGNTTPGPAITQKLKGDAKAGAQVFADNCKKCHGDQGKGGVENPGSADGTIPPLGPVDEPEAMHSNNPEEFALVLDLFIEHGSTPEGPNPKEVMDAWGDKGKLTPQQIADVIAYIIGLNEK